MKNQLSIYSSKQSRHKYNIEYIRLDEKHIGAKRNMAVEKVKRIIVGMDDDDYYYPFNKNRVQTLVGLSERRQIRVFAATFAAFEINKYISMINNKNYNSPFYKTSPATSIFPFQPKNENHRFSIQIIRPKI